MSKLTLSILSLLTLGASAYSAPINEADWDFQSDSHYEDGAIVFNGACLASLKNGENYSTKSTISYTIEIPTEIVAMGGSLKGISAASYLFGSYGYMANVYISSELNANYANTYIRYDPDANLELFTQTLDSTEPLRITFSYEYSDGNCIASIKSDTDSRIDVSKTFSGNPYNTYEGFAFSIENPSGDIDLTKTPIKIVDFSYIPQVPEPATYAAIFGALALGFAAYRRRK